MQPERKAKPAFLSLMVIFALVLGGCGGGSSSGSTGAPTVAYISFSGATNSAISLAVGGTNQLKVIATFNNGTTTDVSSQASFATSSASVATVSSSGTITGVAPGTATITGTYQSLTTSIAVTVTANAPTVQSIAITPPPASLAAGATTQLQVTATFSDNTTQDVTSTATYTSSDATIATVSSSGLVTAVSAGTATITATYQGTNATATIAVTPVAVTALALSAASGGSTLSVGGNVQLVATATLANGTIVAVTSGVTYTSSNPAVATVDASSGNVTAISAGTVTITAGYQGQTGTIQITVIAAAPTVVSIAVTSSATSLVAGSTAQLMAVATNSDGTTANVTSQATYTSSAPGVATVNSGVITALSAGTAVITASYQGQMATVTITVTPATANSISITALGNNLPAGTPGQLQVTATLSDGTTADVSTSATYTSSNPSVATVSGSGAITTLAPGTTVITATYEGKTSTITITVTAATAQSIVVTAAAAQIAKGLTTQLQVTATLTNTTTSDVTSQASYISSAPAVATVTNAGVVTAASVGTAAITATYEGKTATVTITITAATTTSISLTTSDSSLPLGLTAQLTATATFTDGTTTDETSTATYTSSNPAIATVSASGAITTVAQGTTVITATFQSQTATVSITVTAPEIVSITINPSIVELANGVTEQLQALATFTDGTLSDVTSTAIWGTSPAVATISASGSLTAVGTGTTTITVIQGGVSGTADLIVTAATLSSIVLLPQNPSVNAGGTLQITGQGIFTDGTTQNITDKLSFATSDPSVVTVSSSGLVAGVTPGTATITVTVDPSLGTHTASASFVVTPATLSSLAVSPNTVSVPSGLSQQMTATGTYSDGSSQDMTQTVTWASSNTNVAIVNSNGVVTALNVGNATITATAIGGAPVASATITVTSATIASLAITPTNISLAVGQSLPITVTATFTDNSTQDVTTTAALSVSGGLASIINGSLSNQRLVLATLAGTGTVTASLGGQTVQAALTVGPSQITAITLPATASVGVGASTALQVQAQYTDGTSQLLTTNLNFSSGTTAVATVDALGNVTGVAQGTALITATYNNPSGGTFSASTTVTVNAATLASITVTAEDSVNAVGIPIHLLVIGNYSDGSIVNITSQVHITSSNPSIAVVSNLGVVTPLAVGATQISATLNGVTGSLILNIGNAVLQSIAVSAPPTLAIGATSHLIAMGTFSDSTTQDISSQVTWSSSNLSLGVIDANGNAVGIAPGTFTALAVLNGKSGQASIQVTAAGPATLLSITVTPSTVTLVGSLLNVLGVTTPFTATGNYSDGSTADLTSTVQWSTSNGATATINAQGQMQLTLAGLLGLVGLGPSQITVNATFGGTTGTATVTLTVL